MNYHHKIIGREREKQVLTELIEATRSGAGNIVLIAGEAGMGKTVLAEEMLARSDLHCFSGRSSEGATSPYTPVTTILRDYLRQTGTQKIDCGPLTPYLPCLLPGMGHVKAQPDAETIIETIIAALAAITKRAPSVIFLDDLHWADNATLHILPVIAERLHTLPLLILGTYRNDEIPRGHQLRRMPTELRRRRLLHEITIENLNRDQTAQLKLLHNTRPREKHTILHTIFAAIKETICWHSYVSDVWRMYYFAPAIGNSVPIYVRKF